MIIDTPSILQLAIGTDKRIPQDGDNQIVVPPTLIPVTQPTTIIRAGQSAGELQNTSFVILTSDSRTNQVANSTNLCTVAKGLWDFTFVLTARSNYISASLVNGAQIDWSNGLFTVSLLNRLPVGTATVPQSTVDVLPVRMLLNETATFILSIGVTGVGQTMEAILRLIGNRII